jgi:hypothetical protein
MMRALKRAELIAEASQISLPAGGLVEHSDLMGIPTWSHPAIWMIGRMALSTRSFAMTFFMDEVLWT